MVEAVWKIVWKLLIIKKMHISIDRVIISNLFTQLMSKICPQKSVNRNVHVIFSHNNPKLETSCDSINRKMYEYTGKFIHWDIAQQ